MPYASEKQRKFMHAQHPGIAAQWDAESRPRMLDERAGHGRKRVEKSLSEVSKLTMGPNGMMENKKTAQRRNLAAEAQRRGMSQSKIRHERAASGMEQRASYVAGRAKPAEKLSRMFRLSQMKVPGGRATAGAALVGAGLGAGALAGGARRAVHPYEVTSENKRRGREATHAAVGAGGAYGAYAGGGYVANMKLRDMARNDKKSHKLMNKYSHEMKMPKGGLLQQGVPYAARQKFFENIPAGVKGGGTRRVLAHTHGAGRFGRLAVPVAAAGGAAGFVHAKVSEKRPVAKGDADYPFLPSNIRQEVEWGIPETRQNPISPLQMIAGANIAAEGYTDLKRKWPFGKKKRRERGMFKLGVAEQLSPSSVGLVGA